MQHECEDESEEMDREVRALGSTQPDMNAEHRECIRSFTRQAPPGEINDVLNDLRTIVQDDDSLEEAVQPALREYNIVQFITVQVPGTDHSVLPHSSESLCL